MSKVIIKCLKCGHVLMSGFNMVTIFTAGTSIECKKCGNKYVFGEKESAGQEKPKITFQA